MTVRKFTGSYKVIRIHCSYLVVIDTESKSCQPPKEIRFVVSLFLNLDS